jgi:ArsR family transcriptional regulator
MTPKTARRPGPAPKPSPPREQDLEAIYAMQADICRALGHPKRIHILDLLAEGEKGANRLREALDVSKVNLSQHLALLRGAGLVRSRKAGREVSYSLALPEVKEACGFIRHVLAARLERGTELAERLHASTGAGERGKRARGSRTQGSGKP